MLERIRIALNKHQLTLFILVFISASLVVMTNTIFTRTVEAKIYISTQPDLNELSGFSVAGSDLHLRNSSTAIDNWQRLIHSINNSAADCPTCRGLHCKY